MKRKENFRKTCARLKPWHRRRLAVYLPYALARARTSGLPGAEEVAVAALVRAVVTFRRRPKSKDNACAAELPKGKRRRTQLLRWIALKVGFALRNLQAEFPMTDVRDAVIDFKARFGRWPDLSELCKFSGIGPRQVLNVWLRVAEELRIAAAEDPILASLELGRAKKKRNKRKKKPKPAANALHCLSVERVRQVLARLDAADACLLILFDVCDYSEKEVIEFLRQARDLRDQHAGDDAILDLLDDFTKARTTGLNPPWDKRLFGYTKPGPLRTALHRARERFEKLSQ